MNVEIDWITAAAIPVSHSLGFVSGRPYKQLAVGDVGYLRPSPPHLGASCSRLAFYTILFFTVFFLKQRPLRMERMMMLMMAMKVATTRIVLF